MRKRLKWLYRHKPATLMLCIILLALCVGCTTFNPATGRNEFIAISTSEEIGLGRNVHSELSGEYSFITSGAQYDRLQRIGERISQVSDRQDYSYTYYLIDADELNAFTTPGGNIYFYSGLMNRLTDDAQVAGVVAHEVGHCAAKHVVKKFQAAMGYNLIGSILLSQIDSGSARQIADLSSGAIMKLVFSAYSRKDEYQADILGIKYMYLAGYEPQGFVETLEILDEEAKGPNVPLMLRSHPHLKDRIEAVKQEIQNVEAKYNENYVKR